MLSQSVLALPYTSVVCIEWNRQYKSHGVPSYLVNDSNYINGVGLQCCFAASIPVFAIRETAALSGSTM